MQKKLSKVSNLRPNWRTIASGDATNLLEVGKSLQYYTRRASWEVFRGSWLVFRCRCQEGDFIQKNGYGMHMQLCVQNGHNISIQFYCNRFVHDSWNWSGSKPPSRLIVVMDRPMLENWLCRSDSKPVFLTSCPANPFFFVKKFYQIEELYGSKDLVAGNKPFHCNLAAVSSCRVVVVCILMPTTYFIACNFLLTLI